MFGNGLRIEIASWLAGGGGGIADRARRLSIDVSMDSGWACGLLGVDRWWFEVGRASRRVDSSAKAGALGHRLP